MTGDLPARLREATRAEHEAIESAVPLLRDGLGLAEYAAHVARLHAFTAPLEDVVARRLGDGGLWREARRRAPLMALDLRDLGRPALPPAPADALPDLPAFAHAAGALYVLEGSRLGGLVILRQLGPRLGLAADHGARHLAPPPDGAGSWPGFRRELAEAVQGETAEEAACAGAVATFRSLRRWLTA